MPAKGVERALQAERAGFDEQCLREYVALVQSRPENLLDGDAMSRWSSAQQAFAQKCAYEDPTKRSRQALERVWM